MRVSFICTHVVFKVYCAKLYLTNYIYAVVLMQCEGIFLEDCSVCEFPLAMHKVSSESILSLPAPALLSRVTEEDQKLLKTLLPRVRSLTQRCGQGLSYVVSVKTAISYW